MKRFAIAAAVAGAMACAAVAPPVVAPGPRLGAGELPSLERWRRHVIDELMPFWLAPDALGTPIGNGTLHEPRKLGTRHTDFGHSMKSLWMLYLTGQRTGECELVDFARPLIAPLLERAAQPSGCWASGLRADRELDRGSQWWIFAELDQAAATLAGREPSSAPYARYLASSYACWFTRFVDHRNHDVRPGIPPDWTPTTFEAQQPPKIFHWKNGYHAMEHALVALITTAGLTGQRLPLYYAFVKTPPRQRIQPYYFSGTISNERDHPLLQRPAFHGRRVEFRELR